MINIRKYCYKRAYFQQIRQEATNQTLNINFQNILTDVAFPYLVKACVHYFLLNCYFSPNDSPSKTMKNVFYFI